MKGYAMITGASGGLGKAFARVLLKRGERLLLTGRNEKKVLAVQEELKREYPTADIRAFVADLSNEASRHAMMEKIRNEKLPIGMLVNAAGVDVQKGVFEYTQEKIAFQCRVNFEAAVSLSRFAMENRAERLEIINVSSVSGIYPMPYFAIYSASKCALTAFSVALREEVKKQNIAVTAVLPGAMPTREDIKAQIKGQGIWGKLAVKSPEWVAEKSIKAVRKNKRKLIPGFWNKMMRIFTAFIPLSLKLRFIANRWSKISKDAF